MQFRAIATSLILISALLSTSGSVAAQSAGEVLWSVELGFNFILPPPTVAPDGTIYMNSEDLFAISPDGEVLWTAEHFGAHVVGLGEDGTVYASNGADVSAYDPDGNLLWTFVEDPPGGGFMAGPTVGPDGNVYAVSDSLSAGLGAFSLTPDGDLRWSLAGFEDHQPFGFRNAPLAFAAGRLYFAFDRVPECEGTGLISLRLADGSIDWCTDTSGHSRVATGLQGRAHLGALDLLTFDTDGELLWVGDVLQPGEPAVAPDGAVFLFGDNYDLHAFEPDGSVRWTVENAADGNFPSDPPALSPDGTALVFGTGLSFGENGAVHAHEPATGAELWTVPLTGPSEGATGPPAFSPDGSVVYVPTSTSSTSELVAIQVHDEGAGLVISPPEPGIAGVVNCFDVAGATAGGRVRLYLGLDAGQTLLRGCSTPLGIADARGRDTQVADAAGDVTLCTLVPSGAQGRSVLAQALDRDAPGCAVSNVDSTIYE